MQIDTSFTSTHSSSRNGAPVLAIVIHATAGTNSLSWLIKNPDQVSAHYLIRKDGWIYQLVALDRAAHHCGYSKITVDGKTYSQSTSPDPNQISVGIELENLNNGKDPYPVAQIAALRELLDFLRARYPKALLFFHRDIDTRGKTDPRGLDWPDIFPPDPKPHTRVIGTGPSVTYEQFTAWLKRRKAPIVDVVIERIYQLSVWLDIDPAFIAAIWAHETSQTPGVIGSSDLFKKSNNAGAIVAYGRWPSVTHNGRQFNKYESAQLGLMHLVVHLKQIYGAVGLLDVETIIPVYAPAEDNNQPQSYIQAVLRDMREMRSL